MEPEIAPDVRIFYVGDHPAEVEEFFQPFPNVDLYVHDCSQDLIAQFKQVQPFLLICDFSTRGLDIVSFFIEVRNRIEPWTDIFAVHFPKNVSSDHGQFWLNGIEVWGPEVHISGDFPDPKTNMEYNALMRRFLSF